MDVASLTPERVQQIIALYITMSHDGGYYFDPHDRELAIQLAYRWLPSSTQSDDLQVEGLVDMTFMAVRSGASQGLDELAQALCEELPPHVCHELLSDLGRLALANGHSSLRMAEAIRHVRALWQRPGASQAAAA